MPLRTRTDSVPLILDYLMSHGVFHVPPHTGNEVGKLGHLKNGISHGISHGCCGVVRRLCASTLEIKHLKHAEHLSNGHHVDVFSFEDAGSAAAAASTLAHYAPNDFGKRIRLEIRTKI